MRFTRTEHVGVRSIAPSLLCPTVIPCVNATAENLTADTDVAVHCGVACDFIVKSLDLQGNGARSFKRDSVTVP